MFDMIPQGWKIVELSEIADGDYGIVDGPFGSNLKVSDYIDDSVNGVPVLTTKNLNGDYSKDSVRYISKEKFDSLKRSAVTPGDIIVAKIGTIGKCGIYPLDQRIALIPANLLKITSKSDVNRKYVFYYIQSAEFQKWIKSIATATAQPAFNVTKFRKLPIPIPSLPEQNRIVARIEELFSELDNGVETLRKTKQQLAVYRQAVISAAFPEMTEENTVRLDEIAVISGGITKGRDLSKQETIHLPYLRVANVQNGYLDLSQMKTIELKTSEMEKYLLCAGDVLYTEGGDRDKLGRGTVWNDEIPNCVHQNHVFKARLDQAKANPRYVAYWSMSAFTRNYFYNKGKQSVNLASINKTVLSALTLPLPSLAEQEAALRVIESHLSVCDEIEKTVEIALQQAETMRQSILKQAFEGRL